MNNTTKTDNNTPVGRYAPSPSGRMHLGNIYAALISWLSVKTRRGRWILRIEDLDPQRSRHEYARLIEDDLQWLGLSWDEGGLDNIGKHGPYCQSLRSHFYDQILTRLTSMGLTYPCHCRRSDILSTQAPHQSDGRVVYAGTCRPAPRPPFNTSYDTQGCSTRIYVPDRDILFTDKVYGQQSVNLAHHCGDFILRRADGAWAYQLAVVVDDALMGVTEVVRGNDLLLSSAQQIYLYELLGYNIPQWCHIPLLVNKDGQRLSKRDGAMSMEELRKKHSPERIIGHLAYLTRLTDHDEDCTPTDLLTTFNTIRPLHSITV